MNPGREELNEAVSRIVRTCSTMQKFVAGQFVTGFEQYGANAELAVSSKVSIAGDVEPGRAGKQRNQTPHSPDVVEGAVWEWNVQAEDRELLGIRDNKISVVSIRRIHHFPAFSTRTNGSQTDSCKLAVLS